MNFYKMNLGDSEWSSGMCASVLRVPGGWVLRSWSEENGEHTHGTFIPFNNEFMEISDQGEAEKPAANTDYTALFVDKIGNWLDENLLNGTRGEAVHSLASQLNSVVIKQQQNCV